jgi:hypothetical protein
MAEVLENADLTIENADSLERFRDRVRTVLQEGAAGLEETAVDTGQEQA